MILDLDDKVRYMLFTSALSCHKIHDLTGISYQSISNFRSKRHDYNNMPFKSAKLLGYCYDKLIAHKNKEGVAQ